MKLVFFYFERGYRKNNHRTIWYGRFYYSLGVLMTFLKNKGYKVSYYPFIYPPSSFEIKKILDFEKPNVIGLSSLTHLRNEVKRVSKIIKRISSNIFTIYGGVHPTINPDDAISFNGIDGICIGESENTLLEILDRLNKNLDFYDIPGFWFKKNNKIVKNVSCSKLVELNLLPFVDLKLSKYDYSDDYRVFKRFPIMSARGCLFNCDFCCNQVWKSIYNNKYFRFRSPEYVVDEIKYVKSLYSDIENIQFQNDIFFPDLNWLVRFVKLYKDINIPISILMTASMVSRESIKLLRKLPIKEVFLGVESGKNIRKKIGKGIKNITEKSFYLLNNANIPVAVFNMIGIPGESGRDIKKSIVFNARINPKMVQLSYLYPYYNTKIYKKYYSFLSNKQYFTYFEGSILKNKNLNHHLKFYYTYFIDLIEIYININSWFDRKIFDFLFNDYLFISLKRIIIRYLKKKYVKNKIFRVRF